MAVAAKLPLRVDFEFAHNHEEHSAAVLARKDVTQETCVRIWELLDAGFGPDETCMKLRGETGDGLSGAEFVKACADRGKAPDYNFVYR